MARNQKKYTDLDRESAVAEYMSGKSLTEVSKTRKVPIATLSRWINEKPPAEVEKARNEKKAEFARMAWEPIANAMSLINRELLVALDRQKEIEDAIEVIGNTSDNEMKYKEREAAIRRLSKLERFDLRELTTAIGTLYDKQALASGDSTNNMDITMTEADKALLDKVSKRLDKK